MFTQWLSQEANEANAIKKDTPVMCVIGNPPYAVSSTNKGPWIQNLIADYKKDLNERKINLDDDYIKFIRYGQHFIDKNGEGVLAYISANSFLDGATHRQMRKSLLESFDQVYIIDLHGNAKKKEVCPDGSIDQNVFDIMTGVSINIFVKTGRKKKNELGQVRQIDVFGKRNFKYELLNENSINSLKWNLIEVSQPYYFFTTIDFTEKSTYDLGFNLGDLFIEKNTGIQTKNDSLTIQFRKESIQKIEKDFLEKEIDELREIYGIKDGTWKLSAAKSDLLTCKHEISDILIKPFDKRFTIFNTISGGFLGRPRYNTMKNMLGGRNLALLLGRQNKSQTIDSFFITNTLSEMKSAERTIQSYHFPLYIYSNIENQHSLDKSVRTPNLDYKIVSKIAKGISHTFVPDENIIVDLFPNSKGAVYPLDILDYIYAVLYSPSYREKYKEFLKIDFPRVPYPTDADKFWKLVALGKELREIHLLESPKVEEYITGYPEDGDNIVGKPKFVPVTSSDPEVTKGSYREEGNVYINETQYFSNVPEVAWNFFIGGYQPAQKWLKDRKDRELSYDDILHYQKIIVALTETNRLMKEIDEVGV